MAEWDRGCVRGRSWAEAASSVQCQSLQTQWEQESHLQLLWSVMGFWQSLMSHELHSHGHLVLVDDDTYGEDGDKVNFPPVGCQGREILIQRYHIRGLSFALLVVSALLLSSELGPLVLIMVLEFVAGSFLWSQLETDQQMISHRPSRHQIAMGFRFHRLCIKPPDRTTSSF